MKMTTEERMKMYESVVNSVLQQTKEEKTNNTMELFEIKIKEISSKDLMKLSGMIQDELLNRTPFGWIYYGGMHHEKH